MAGQERKLPTETETAAYQGNSTIKVWVSLDPDSLRLDLNGNIKTASYGLIDDDPLDIDNTLEKLDYSFGTGGVVGFKLRLINPSVNLEKQLLKIYNTYYDETDAAVQSSLDELADEAYSVNSRGERVTKNTSNSLPPAIPPFPTFYIRWGYGKSIEEGISSVHTAKLVDLKYRLNAKKERIAELTLMDPFSFAGESTQNPISQEGLSAKTALYSEGENLKLPSQLIGELFSDFAASFPEIMFYTDLDSGDVGKRLDVALYEMIAAISEAGDDVLLKLTDGQALEDPIVTENFSEQEIAIIREAVKNRQDPKAFRQSLPGQYRKTNAGVEILAYKLLFTRLGFNFQFYRQEISTDLETKLSLNQNKKEGTTESQQQEDELERLMAGTSKVVDSEAFISIKDDPGGFRPATPEEIVEIQTQLKVGYDSLPVTITFPESVNPHEVKRGSAIWVQYKNYNSNPGVFELVDGEYAPFFDGRYGRGGYAELTEKGLTQLNSQLSKDSQTPLEETLTSDPETEESTESQRNRTLESDSGVYLITYDSDENESVLQGLQKVLTNINTLLPDRVSRVWYSYIDFNSLSDATIDALVFNKKSNSEGRALAGLVKDKFLEGKSIPADEVKKNIGMLLITDDSSLKIQANSTLLKKVFSFPEITQEGVLTKGDDESSNNIKDYIYLDVARENSIVVDLSFAGDQRILASLAQVPFITRQARQYKELFDTKEQSIDVIQFLVRAAELDSLGKEGESFTSTLNSPIRRKDQFITESTVQSILIPYLRKVVSEEKKRASLVGSFTYREMTMGTLEKPVYFDKLDDAFLANLLAIFESDSLLDILFPLNKKSIQSYYRIDGNTIQRVTNSTKLTREIKIYEALSKNNNNLDSYIKDTIIAAENLASEAWSVEVVTLGIPELDIPQQEIFSRGVELSVWDERTQNAHWLTGRYQILGVAHAIDPSKGYLTKLKLIKGVL